MHDWPAEPESEIPAPRLVAAWLLLDTLPAERVPLWAAYWLADGYDGESLRLLAGLSGRNPYDVRDLLPAALRECGVDGGGLSQRQAGTWQQPWLRSLLSLGCTPRLG